MRIAGGQYMQGVRGAPVIPEEPSWKGAMAADGQTGELSQSSWDRLTSLTSTLVSYTNADCFKSMCFGVVRAASLLWQQVMDTVVNNYWFEFVEQSLSGCMAYLPN